MWDYQSVVVAIDPGLQVCGFPYSIAVMVVVVVVVVVKTF
jgi:hypothetical protein